MRSDGHLTNIFEEKKHSAKTTSAFSIITKPYHTRHIVVHYACGVIERI